MHMHICQAAQKSGADNWALNCKRWVFLFWFLDPGTIREMLLALVVTFLWQTVLRIVGDSSRTYVPCTWRSRRGPGHRLVTHLRQWQIIKKLFLHHICLRNIDDNRIKCRMNFQYHANSPMLTGVIACYFVLWQLGLFAWTSIIPVFWFLALLNARALIS